METPVGNVPVDICLWYRPFREDDKNFKILNWNLVNNVELLPPKSAKTFDESLQILSPRKSVKEFNLYDS